MKFCLGFITGVGCTLTAGYLVLANADVVTAAITGANEAIEARKNESQDSTSETTETTGLELSREP